MHKWGIKRVERLGDLLVNRIGYKCLIIYHVNNILISFVFFIKFSIIYCIILKVFYTFAIELENNGTISEHQYSIFSHQVYLD
jgi:uncharacterized protein (DUF486 family)